MAIIVPHRFLDRLAPGGDVPRIRYLMIGTFNPGRPCNDQLTDEERVLVENIVEGAQYKKIDAVRNFYDRPANRFWGVMDRLHKPDLYQAHGVKHRNSNGLKYFATLKREEVYDRQQAFCRAQGVFISDIIRSIEPTSLAGIYKQFKDTDIDGCVRQWNTNQLLAAIEQYDPIKVIFSFKEGEAIPNISREMRRIKTQYPGKVVSLLSPSGAAGNDYASLIANWQEHIMML
jgi:hypothetical protein